MVFKCYSFQLIFHSYSLLRFCFIFKFKIGPDICGPGTKKVHVIFNYKGKNLLINKDIRCKDDVYSHLYALVVKPDNTYEVRLSY